MSQLERFRHRLQKLSIQRGDILVCRDADTMRNLAMMKITGINFEVPIIFAPEGIEKTTRKQLNEIMAHLPPEPQ